jgi:hypothetical protein
MRFFILDDKLTARPICACERMHLTSKNMYFKIFVSSIYTAQNNGVMGDVWKILSNFYVATAIACNVLMLYIFINNHLAPDSLNVFIIKYTTIGEYDFILNIFLTLIIPLMLFNYFMIYRGNRYKKIIIKYPQAYNKKLFVIYFLVSFLAPLVYVLTQVEIRW